MDRNRHKNLKTFTYEREDHRIIAMITLIKAGGCGCVATAGRLEDILAMLENMDLTE